MRKEGNVIHVNFRTPGKKRNSFIEEDLHLQRFPTKQDLEPNAIDYLYPWTIRVIVILAILLLSLLFF